MSAGLDINSKAKSEIYSTVKSLQNKKDLNDVTAAPFSVFFLLLVAEEKTPKTGQLCRH